MDKGRKALINIHLNLQFQIYSCTFRLIQTTAMRNVYITLFCLGFALASTNGQRLQNFDKSIVKTFNNTPELVEVIADLDAPTTFVSWDSELIRVQIDISIEQITEATFHEILLSGRYRTVGTRVGNTFTLRTPNLHTNVQLNGQDLSERIHITVSVPRPVRSSLAKAEPIATLQEATNE